MGGQGTTSSTTRIDDRRAVIDTTATTAAAAAAESSSQTSKAPTKSILKPASGNNDAAAASRFEDEIEIEIWTGPGHVEAAELTTRLMPSGEQEEGVEGKPEPSEKSDTTTEVTGTAVANDGGAK